MKKFAIILILVMIMTSCSLSEQDVQTDLASEIMVLQEKISDLEAENSELKSKVDDLEDTEDELWIRLKEVQAERDEVINSGRVVSENIEVAYNISLAFRDDISNIFNLLDELNGNKFYDLEYLDAEQKQAITSGAEEYLELVMDWNKEQYEIQEFIGDRPEPYNLYSILGIVEDDPMFHFGADESKTLHFKVFYYKSEVMTGSEDGEPILDFRGPFAGVSAIHLVIEEIDGVWVTTYAGIG